MSVSVSTFLNINDYSNHLQCGFSRLVVQILHMHGKRNEEGGGKGGTMTMKMERTKEEAKDERRG